MLAGPTNRKKSRGDSPDCLAGPNNLRRSGFPKAVSFDDSSPQRYEEICDFQEFYCHGVVVGSGCVPPGKLRADLS